MSESLHVGGLIFEVRRSTRRKTLGLTVGRVGELVAYAPTVTTTDELAGWINKKLLWVNGKLALKEEAAPRIRAPEYVSGESFCYLGRRFRLKVVERQDQPLVFDGTRFRLQRDSGPAEAHFRRWYIQMGMEWLPQRVARLSQLAGKRAAGVEVRDLGFHWGSCGRKGVLFFNWKILQLPVRLVDYVVLHELIHLGERNHGPAFWNAFECALPDARSRQKAIAEQAKEYMVFGLRL